MEWQGWRTKTPAGCAVPSWTGCAAAPVWAEYRRPIVVLLQRFADGDRVAGPVLDPRNCDSPVVAESTAVLRARVRPVIVVIGVGTGAEQVVAPAGADHLVKVG